MPGGFWALKKAASGLLAASRTEGNPDCGDHALASSAIKAGSSAAAAWRMRKVTGWLMPAF